MEGRLKLFIFQEFLLEHIKQLEILTGWNVFNIFMKSINKT